MLIKLYPNFDTALRYPPQERLPSQHALEEENWMLRDALAKAEQWGGSLEAINGATQVQLTVQNITYAGAVKQLNIKEKKQTEGKQSIARVAAENHIWMKPGVQEGHWGIEDEQLRVKLVKEVVREACQSLQQL
ncbi:hypothetical protein FRB94_011537 [Tulasnella sp. JGI-2019a]|nr:hypothetical protein FRB94_011537 [Tulasnella sp. JGI-2019a]